MLSSTWHHLVSSTHTSACEHQHAVIGMRTSTCCHRHANINMLSSACYQLVSLCSPNEDFGKMNKCMLPKRRFWKAGRTFQNAVSNSRRQLVPFFSTISGFSMDFSMVRSPNLVLTPLKSAPKIRISSFVNPSKIFVWEG
jgi:hypothetical protein